MFNPSKVLFFSVSCSSLKLIWNMETKEISALPSGAEYFTSEATLRTQRQLPHLDKNGIAPGFQVLILSEQVKSFQIAGHEVTCQKNSISFRFQISKFSIEAYDELRLCIYYLYYSFLNIVQV